MSFIVAYDMPATHSFVAPTNYLASKNVIFVVSLKFKCETEHCVNPQLIFRDWSGSVGSEKSNDGFNVLFDLCAIYTSSTALFVTKTVHPRHISIHLILGKTDICRTCNHRVAIRYSPEILAKSEYLVLCFTMLQASASSREYLSHERCCIQHCHRNFAM